MSHRNVWSAATLADLGLEVRHLPQLGVRAGPERVLLVDARPEAPHLLLHAAGGDLGRPGLALGLVGPHGLAEARK
eukprot:scaffold271806_cov24-Prasinocladus_malaysianus.AAC.1